MNRIHKDIERSIIEQMDYNRRKKKTEEYSVKVLAYSLLGLVGMIIVLMIIM